ncbi:hypothetical protein ABZT02_18365 [Streptomyces sp. NPDC005402]|uniref:hypothetical protein n=1 Tax=Streptomyces sp. NPDC005402 TaxID=3155338 RepID=UPI00339E87BB
MAVSYTAVVDVDGEGRNGGPEELGAGSASDPEQLPAAGWAACLLGVRRRVATSRKVRLTGTDITAKTSLPHGDDGEFTLSAAARPSSAASTRPRAGTSRTPRTRSAPAAAGSAERDWPTDTQVWNWAESTALSGCGPSARTFL